VLSQGGLAEIGASLPAESRVSEIDTMGKVKDEVAPAKSAKPAKGKSSGAPRGLFAQFLANLGRADVYKPMQGWYVRVYSALGLGVIAATGAWRVYDTTTEYSTYWHYGLSVAVALGLGWLIFRIIHFPPFAEFLIATEAEMNKVSWTSKEDLFRYTAVVLTTVVMMALFLFVVDYIWTYLLTWIGVLNFKGGGSLGSTA
jgi:preprotein translocase subunit SecE